MLKQQHCVLRSQVYANGSGREEQDTQRPGLFVPWYQQFTWRFVCFISYGTPQQGLFTRVRQTRTKWLGEYEPTSTLILIHAYHVIRGKMLSTRSMLGYSVEGFPGTFLLSSCYHQRKWVYLQTLGSLLVQLLYRPRSKSNFVAIVSRNKSTFIRRCHNSNVSNIS